MPTISIRFSESEYKLLRQHIENKGLTISQYIKAMLLEEIEDEYDVSIVNEYLEKKRKNQKRLYSLFITFVILQLPVK